MEQELLNASKHFNIKGNILSIEPYGSGLINSTFIIKTDIKNYILQRINTKLFVDVDGLMNNISLVTDYFHKKNPDKQCIHIIKTKDGKLYYKDNENCFRVYHFVKNSYSMDVVDSAEKFYLTARAFGDFVSNFYDFDASELIEVIPNFHNTEDRYRLFLEALDNNKANRKNEIKEEIKFITDRKNYASRVLNFIRSGDIPLRVTHNDTKLNNILFDKDTNQPLAIIDLDTVMPGTVLYDIGDSLRFGTNATFEDDPNLDNVKFKIEYFEAYVKGYLEKYKPTKAEKDNIAFSAILLTYECGMRFLTDYLNGDTYFRCTRKNHNLDRARNQFKLIQEMEKSLPEMEAIVNKY